MNTNRSLSTLAGAALFALAAVNVQAKTVSTFHANPPVAAKPATTAATPAKATPAADHLAAIKANLAQNRQNLRAYHWTETTVVNQNGEPKSTMVSACSFDATGKMVRTPATVPASAESNGGLRGKIADNKKDDLHQYAHSASSLIRSYIPPDPAKMQKCKDEGKMTMTVLEPGKEVRLSFKDYQKPGDDLSFTVDPATHRIGSVAVASYLESAKDTVRMNAQMAFLADGTSYPSRVQFDTPSKEMAVTVTTSDYHKKTS